MCCGGRWCPKQLGDGGGRIQERTFVLLRHACCEHRLMRRRQNRQRSSSSVVSAKRAGGEPSPRLLCWNWRERLDWPGRWGPSPRGQPALYGSHLGGAGCSTVALVASGCESTSWHVGELEVSGRRQVAWEAEARLCGDAAIPLPRENRLSFELLNK